MQTIDMTSVSLLAPQQFADLTPTFFIGLLKVNYKLINDIIIKIACNVLFSNYLNNSSLYFRP